MPAAYNTGTRLCIVHSILGQLCFPPEQNDLRGETGIERDRERADNALESNPFSATEGSSFGHLLKITLRTFFVETAERKRKSKAIIKMEGKKK